MQGVYPQIRGLGGEVLVVSFSPPARVAAYVQRYPFPFPVVSDPERAAYRAFALDRTSWKDILRPRVIGRYLKMMLRGWLPGKPGEGDDIMQLGGDFVLDAGGRVVFAHPSGEPTDRPGVSALLAAMQAASGRRWPAEGPSAG